MDMKAQNIYKIVAIGDVGTALAVDCPQMRVPCELPHGVKLDRDGVSQPVVFETAGGGYVSVWFERGR